MEPSPDPPKISDRSPESSALSSQRPGKQPWIKPVAWVSVLLILVSALVFVMVWASNFTSRTIRQTGSVLTDLASAFRRGTITLSFLSYATTVHSSHYLQFATLRGTEVFTRKDEARTGFGYIPLPDVVVEARAPVEYTYFLDLNAPWQLVLEDNVLYVLAPDIRHNKPAVDASEIQYEVRKGSLIRDTALAESNLKKSVTQMAEQRAKENISLIRETGRKQTADFVEKWLMKAFTDGSQYAVKVYFPDEAPPIKVKNPPISRE